MAMDILQAISNGVTAQAYATPCLRVNALDAGQRRSRTSDSKTRYQLRINTWDPSGPSINHCPSGARSITYTTNMSTQITPADQAAALLADVCGGAQPQVEMMIGIGLVKDSEAVFFQYLGDDRVPQALMMPSGKPVTRMEGITLTGISIAEGIGEFNSTKLNVFFNTGRGVTIMLTSGLATIWSQCVLTGLIALYTKVLSMSRLSSTAGKVLAR